VFGNVIEGLCIIGNANVGKQSLSKMVRSSLFLSSVSILQESETVHIFEYREEEIVATFIDPPGQWQ
jgi:ABC-type antimicrobial peptide transport system ATPase subunit